MRVIESVEETLFDGFVYDLSTESGSFNVLTKKESQSIICLKNTDSVYVRWKNASMQDAFLLSAEAAEYASKAFPYPICLEFEKVMCPLALYTKKRYSYQMWENPDEPCSAIQHVGTQVICRDTCAFVRNMLAHVLERILKRNDIDGALHYSRANVCKLLDGHIDAADLALSRGYKGTYVNENIPHVRLAKRLEDRNDVDKVRPGERIRFVMVDNDAKVETPAYALEHGMRLDVMEYFVKQLKTPLDMIWGLVMEPDMVYHDILVRHQKARSKELSLEGYLRLFHSKN